jgi:tetratricopeptide (TPR) repeat protein
MYKLVITGIILLLLSTWGMIYAVRVSIAQLIYHHTKFGPNADGYVTHEVNTRCEDAYKFYKHNYYFSILCAEKSWYEYSCSTNNDVRAKELLEIASKWCEIGLTQNKYRSQLRLLKARLLFLENPSQAIDYWKQYVEWDFWYPYNHAVLAEMYIDNGEYEKALKTLELIRNFKESEPLFLKLATAWQHDVTTPPSSTHLSH